MKPSRRGFTALLLGLLWRPWRGTARALPIEPFFAPQSNSGGGATVPASRVEMRRYRADAAILLLGITIYRRASVGGGQASIEETGDPGSKRVTLFFAAGSDAKRAYGLKRMGWIQEVVQESALTPAEATYFGVLSSSPEESLDHARKSISQQQSGRSLYSAVDGRHTAGHSRSAVTHFEFATDTGWSDQHLIDQAHSTFHEGVNVEWRETAWPESAKAAPPTFLFALATLLKQRARQAAGRYVYNEQEYLLELEAGQPHKADRVAPVRGKIRNRRTGHVTAFQVWMEDSPGSTVPVRIEYQPRAFLRLTFEAVPG